jgi:hypothetical protein
MLTLIEMTTTEGWMDVVYSGTSSVGKDMQPKKDNRK